VSLSAAVRAASAVRCSTRDAVCGYIRKRQDAAELPVTHVTRRQGRPYTLVLEKTEALFARERQARSRDETDLEWLAEGQTRRRP
jgi:hypothetical protein